VKGVVPAAFHFVDRIDACDPDGVVRGSVTVPSTVSCLLPCLVAEAVGQLAAWAAMAQMQFETRPVAALVAEARLHGTPLAGERVDLTATFASMSQDAVVYTGSAAVAGATVLELDGCVGAMRPMDEFDDAQRVRRLFESLRGGALATAKDNRAAAVTLPGVVVLPCPPENPRECRATLAVPATAPYLADHFPRRPVFPATLLLHTMLGLGSETVHREVTAAGAQSSLSVRRVRDVKMRSFVDPGTQLELSARVVSTAASSCEVKLQATAAGTLVATARADVELPGS
jgi:3-hydroxymyristoyl/3-hydroxydecanoyl-(acyl carrier protein) dehydratase